MERISIFNYEAFYLDFLEGNLNEEDTALLMAFLEANPDLDVMNDELPIFVHDDIRLDEATKLELKHDLSDVKITTENCDQFFIAEMEGQLSNEKVAELDAFAGEHSEFTNDRKRYAAVIMQPDLSIVYPEKGQLKRRAAVVLWPYYSGIAAAVVIAFFMIWSAFQRTSIDTPSNEQIIANTKDDGAPKTLENGNIEKSNVLQQASALENKAPKEISEKENASNQGIEQRRNVGNDEVRKDVLTHRVNDMENRPVGPIASIDSKELEPVSPHIVTPTKVENKGEQVLAQSYYTGMYNPIEPLTKFVGKKTNTEVDFQTTKKSEDKKRGFFLKIGNFEIDRKKN